MGSYQGGCLFPYISEVGREGFNKFIFVISTFVAVFPWIIYSMYYMETNILYGRYVIKNRFGYYFFALMHVLMCMMQSSSAISFVVASIYDLLRYPIIHEHVRSSLRLHCSTLPGFACWAISLTESTPCCRASSSHRRGPR